MRIMNLFDLAAQYDMFPKGSRVLCAVSGGADSIYLLERLHGARAPCHLDFTVVAAHYNHHLRGEESDRDERFVRSFVSNWCGEEHITSHLPGQEGDYIVPPIKLIVGHGDVAAEAKRRKKGIEETAREMRYEFLFRTAELVGADVIATAHTADDNLETLLLHLARGCGLQGLTGIPPRQGKLVRPMLATTRREIEEYLRIYRIPHVEDSSNADETYSRNRMRRQVLPLLEGFNPALRENSIDTIRYLRADNDYLNAQAAELSAQAQVTEDGVSIAAASIARAPDPLAVRAVRGLLAMTAGGATDCTAAHLEAVVALCRRDDPSGEVRLPGGRTARRVYERLVLTDLPPLPPLEAFAPQRGDNPIPGTGWTLRLDTDPWPGLAVRPRQAGDEIVLPGRPRRSLKKLFIDKKIPRRSRERIPVLADGDGVLAVAGFGPNTAHPQYQAVAFQFLKERKDD